MSIDIEIVTGTTGILAEETLVVSLLNCSLELQAFVPEFTSYVNIGGLSSHSKTNDQGAFNQFVWIMSENLPVLASAWFRLISVNNQVRWSV